MPTIIIPPLVLNQDTCPALRPSTYMGQPCNRGLIDLTNPYRPEGVAMLRCGRTTVMIGFADLAYLSSRAFSLPPSGGSPFSPNRGKILRDSIHSVICEAALGTREEAPAENTQLAANLVPLPSMRHDLPHRRISKSQNLKCENTQDKNCDEIAWKLQN